MKHISIDAIRHGREAAEAYSNEALAELADQIETTDAEEIMTEPRVEAGDRALEKPLEPNHHWKWFRAVGQEECPHKDQVWHKMEPELCRPCFYALKTAEAYAALIQSAMNAQERELVTALYELYPHIHDSGMTGESSFEKAWLKIERLLAERGEGR